MPTVLLNCLNRLGFQSDYNSPSAFRSLMHQELLKGLISWSFVSTVAEGYTMHVFICRSPIAVLFPCSNVWVRTSFGQQRGSVIEKKHRALCAIDFKLVGFSPFFSTSLFLLWIFSVSIVSTENVTGMNRDVS